MSVGNSPLSTGYPWTITATAISSPGDCDYPVQTLWLNTTTNIFYFLLNTPNQAIWTTFPTYAGGTTFNKQEASLTQGNSQGGIGGGVGGANIPMSVNTTATFDMVGFLNSNSEGFNGGVFDGRYIYFVPQGPAGALGQISRYDTTRPFTTTSSYATFDTLGFVNSKSSGFQGGAFDGRYVYLIPYAAATRGW